MSVIRAQLHPEKEIFKQEDFMEIQEKSTPSPGMEQLSIRLLAQESLLINMFENLLTTLKNYATTSTEEQTIDTNIVIHKVISFTNDVTLKGFTEWENKRYLLSLIVQDVKENLFGKIGLRSIVFPILGNIEKIVERISSIHKEIIGLSQKEIAPNSQGNLPDSPDTLQCKTRILLIEQQIEEINGNLREAVEANEPEKIELLQITLQKKIVSLKKWQIELKRLQESEEQFKTSSQERKEKQAPLTREELIPREDSDVRTYRLQQRTSFLAKVTEMKQILKEDHNVVDCLKDIDIVFTLAEKIFAKLVGNKANLQKFIGRIIPHTGDTPVDENKNDMKEIKRELDRADSQIEEIKLGVTTFTDLLLEEMKRQLNDAPPLEENMIMIQKRVGEVLSCADTITVYTKEEPRIPPSPKAIHKKTVRSPIVPAKNPVLKPATQDIPTESERSDTLQDNRFEIHSDIPIGDEGFVEEKSNRKNKLSSSQEKDLLNILFPSTLWETNLAQSIKDLLNIKDRVQNINGRFNLLEEIITRLEERIGILQVINNRLTKKYKKQSKDTLIPAEEGVEIPTLTYFGKLLKQATIHHEIERLKEQVRQLEEEQMKLLGKKSSPRIRTKQPTHSHRTRQEKLAVAQEMEKQEEGLYDHRKGLIPVLLQQEKEEQDSGLKSLIQKELLTSIQQQLVFLQKNYDNTPSLRAVFRQELIILKREKALIEHKQKEKAPFANISRQLLQDIANITTLIAKAKKRAVTSMHRSAYKEEEKRAAILNSASELIPLLQQKIALIQSIPEPKRTLKMKQDFSNTVDTLKKEQTLIKEYSHQRILTKKLAIGNVIYFS